MRHTQARAGFGLVFPPVEIRMPSAQIDHGLQAVGAEKARQQSEIGLRRARRVAGHDPVEIVEEVEEFAHERAASISSAAPFRSRKSCGLFSSLSNAVPTGWRR